MIHFLLNWGFFVNTKNTMAKRQRTMRNMFLRNEGHIDVSNESLTNTSNTKKEFTLVEASKLVWKDAWYYQFHWIEFNHT